MANASLDCSLTKRSEVPTESPAVLSRKGRLSANSGMTSCATLQRVELPRTKSIVSG